MKKFRIFLLLIILLHGLALHVHAVEIPNANRTGSLTLAMYGEGKPLNSGRLTIYRVGDIVQSNGDFSFALIPELQDSGIVLDDLDDTVLPRILADQAQRRGLRPITVSIQNGLAIFSQLKPGLFVVMQEEADASDGFAPIRPFLVSLPVWNGTTYVYEVTAKPKVSIESIPTEPPETEPPKPTEPNLPQTGQLKWPIPVMAVSGLAFLTAGVYLCFGKKERHET